MIGDDLIKIESRHGGTLRGIMENLDYIEKLKVNCLYLNPIFKATSYHKYDTINYFEIDPCFGTKEDLKQLVQACHKKGIRVILDGVFNHCGSGFFPFVDVLKKGEKSEYVHWFYQLNYPVKYEGIPNYEAFAYVKEMPKLNTGNREVMDYFCQVGSYWIREADIDGWRLDVANEINHDFWRAFRKAVEKEKEDVFLIGEIWENSAVWLMGDQFHSTMNYTFSNVCREFFAQESITVTEFDEKMQQMMMRYPEMVARAQMNFLDTHDIPRFLSACGEDKSKLKLAVFYMMCAMGIPSVFYGDERGICGVTEADYRKPMPWDEEQELADFYGTYIGIRRKSPALCCGSYETILCDDENRVYIFARETKEEKLFVIINGGSKEQRIQLSQWEKGAWMDMKDPDIKYTDQMDCAPMSGRIMKKMETVVK